MKTLSSPIVGRDELIGKAAVARGGGSKIVLANGCFDLFHAGHVRYLQGAAELGDFLIVAVNSDRQTRLLKGEGRPFTPESERAEIVASLKYVDIVTIFDEPTVDQIINAVKPDVHAKGTDYTTDTVPEREIVRAYGGTVAIVGDPKDHSSTEIIERIASETRA